MHYYQFDIADYQSHTRHLSPTEDICYRRMLDWIYLHEKPLPSDPENVARLLILNECLTDVERVLNEFFIHVEHGWVNVRAMSEIEAFNDRIEKASKAGKASAEARKNKLKQELKESQHAFNGCSTDVQPTKNQEPRTINHKTIYKKQTKKSTDFVLPGWVNKSHWDIWISKNKKKTDAQKQLAVDKLKRWMDSGLNYEQALEDAAEGGWQGLHEPKPSRASPDRRSTNEQTTKAAYKKIFGVDMDANEERDITHESARL